jgi:ribose-phosphate pyrophosphokinase
MKHVVIAIPDNEALASAIAGGIGAELGKLIHRKFPDGETYLRFDTDVKLRNVILCCTLNDPDRKSLPLLLAAAALRDLGAAKISLVAPYLGYMRQDRRFKDGEAVTSTAFARLISSFFDWLATVDPHLHRHKSLDEIYTIPSVVGHATLVLLDYLHKHPGNLFLVGPDEESEQWVASLARDARIPYVTLRKTRFGDRDVAVEFPDLTPYSGRTPILVDDVISSGRTMEVASVELRRRGFAAPVCLATHGVLADGALARLVATGATVITTNTIPGPTANLDVHPLLSEIIAEKFKD